MADNMNKDDTLATTGSTVGSSGMGASTAGIATTKPSSPASDIDYASNATGSSTGGMGDPSEHREEAKSRFSAALAEAKAGAAALKAEAGTRASSYKGQALERGQDYGKTAKEYGDQARVKASELAVDGKAKASEALLALSRLVEDNAATVDQSLGAKYGDYARTASRSIKQTAEKLDQKSVEELGEDARQFVRTSPGAAIGIAAVAGYMIARIFSGSRK